MINSKKKGGRFELYCAKLLTEKTGIKWYRVGVSSGARYTTIGAEKYRGDITTDHKDFQSTVIECKATKGRITLEDIANKSSKLWKWIKQSEEESDGDNWILIFKANNGKVFAVTVSIEHTRAYRIASNFEHLFSFDIYDMWVIE